jgi:hypothetical protein
MVLLPGFHAAQAAEVGGIVSTLKSQRRAWRNFAPAEIAGQWKTDLVFRTGTNRRTGLGFGLHDPTSSAYL